MKPSLYGSTTTKLRVALVAGAVVASGLLASAAGASYGGTTIGNGIAPAAVQQGQTLLIEGSGYKVGAAITILIEPSKVLGHTRSNGSGTFKSNVKIPAGLSVGKHVVEFKGSGTNGTTRFDRLVITVHKKR
jgi:hypothetical protein